MTGTRCVYLLGRPLGHSLSVPMQDAGFAALGIDARYLALEVAPDELESALERVRQDDCLGANVTLPHKMTVGVHLDGLDELAARLGSVNTIVNRSGSLHGLNTDVGGLSDALTQIEASVAGRDCVVLGGSGAAAAAVAALGQRHPRSILVAAREPDAAARLSALSVAAHPGRLPSPELEEALGGAALVVNATSAGLDGVTSPLESLPARRDAVLLDLIYRPFPTPLMTMAAARGWAVHGGLTMLLGQGTRSFTAWTGRPAPVGAMREALLVAAG
ncbi:MAG: shikimate dehydrogenase family protein [Candidatus Dormibacteria bacterium]